MTPGDVGSLLGHSKLPHAKAPEAPTTLNVAMSTTTAHGDSNPPSFGMTGGHLMTGDDICGFV